MNGDPKTNTADQRRSDRRAVEAPVRMRIESEALGGLADNISSLGMMFFTDEPLRVVVEVDEGGETKSYPGRLVRLQRMSEQNSGLAIEFDEPQ